MNFKFFLSTITVMLMLLSFDAHSNNGCELPSSSTYDDMVTVREGQIKHVTFELPKWSGFRMNESTPGFRKNFHRLKYFDLTYRFETVDGSAKAGEHYKEIKTQANGQYPEIWFSNSDFFIYHRYQGSVVVTGIKDNNRWKKARTTTYNTNMYANEGKTCLYYKIRFDRPRLNFGWSYVRSNGYGNTNVKAWDATNHHFFYPFTHNQNHNVYTVLVQIVADTSSDSSGAPR